MNAAPWRAGTRLDARAFAGVRLRTIFECAKWDPQVGDQAILADFPLILTRPAWQSIAAEVEGLAAETIAAEAEIRRRPDLLRLLRLPAAIARRWQRLPAADQVPGARVMRFDVHFTADSWQISEVNSDVPGGFNEASGFTMLMAQHYDGVSLAGDPAGALAEAIGVATAGKASVACVAATAYSDDVQVLHYLSQQIKARGLRPSIVAPDAIQWRGGAAWLRGEPVGMIVRFFPAEWLPNLARRHQWAPYFADAATPQCNPTLALLSQSKRFPLTWPALQTGVPTWRARLPETRDPRDVSDLADSTWVLKPALGRVGEGIGISGVSSPAEWRTAARAARRFPQHWVAQRRFIALPLVAGGIEWYPVLGVYTVNGRAAGIYGRLARRPLVDSTALDIAVLIEDVR